MSKNTQAWVLRLKAFILLLERKMPKHYIVTNRAFTKNVPREDRKDYYPSNSAKSEYIRIDGDEEASDNLRYGTVSFNSSGKTKFEIEIEPENLKKEELVDYAKEIKPRQKLYASEKMFKEIYESGSKNSAREDILIFVHGYNADLDTALGSVKKLHEKYVENPNSTIKHIILFTWPAKEKILKYRDDARDAKLSGYALARSLAKLKDLYKKYFVHNKKPQCEQYLHLMCHSMGNRVLESMFVGLASMNVELNTMFKEIILTGADIDYDSIHEPKPLSRVIDLSERVHIYYHNNDRALGISEMTKNAFNRLGRWGAKNSLKLSDGVFQSDVTDIRDEKFGKGTVAHHWYHFDSPSVIEDMIAVFNGEDSIFAD